MQRRAKGEGSWDIKVTKGYEYVRFRKKYGKVTKEFYGKTRPEVMKKVKRFEENYTDVSGVDCMFQDYMRDWLARYREKEIGESTYTVNYNAYRGHIKNTSLGRTQVRRLTSRQIQDFVNQMAEEYSRNTIRGNLNTIRACLKHAVEFNELSSNPCDKVKIPLEKNMKVKTKKVPYLTTEEVKLLCKEIKRKEPDGKPAYAPHYYCFIVIVFTGMRKGEMLALRWENVHFKEKYIEIKENKVRKTDFSTGKGYLVTAAPKYDSYRKIPLCDAALDALKYIKENSSGEHVINVCSGTLNRGIKRVLKNAGITDKNYTVHALRHTFGSMLLEQGVELKVISELLGHKDISVTANIYVNVTEKLSKKSISALNNIDI